MIVFEIVGSEANTVYSELELENGERHYDFLRSIVRTALALDKPFLSSQVLKALNFHAIACLHTSAGEFRPCQVTVGTHCPPAHFQVQALMDDFVNTVNRRWETADPLTLATYVLWRLNFIHPFINGNGRTARAASYFVLCVKVGQWLPGRTILPELISRERNRYVAALQQLDDSFKNGNLDLTPLHSLLADLLQEQIGSIEQEDNNENQ